MVPGTWYGAYFLLDFMILLCISEANFDDIEQLHAVMIVPYCTLLYRSMGEVPTGVLTYDALLPIEVLFGDNPLEI